MVIPKHKEDNWRSETDEWKAPSYGAVEGQSLKMFIEHFHSPISQSFNPDALETVVCKALS